jgi:type I restriction enzyme S subunit
MNDMWISTTIGDQVTLQRGIDITKASQRPGDIPVISSGGISSFHDIAFANGPGVVLGRKGVVGSVYYIKSDFWPHDTSLWVRDFHGNHPGFVYYFFTDLAPILASMDVGSANPTLNRNHVHPIRIQWPPIEEQRAIAHILGTLDDKIELNRQMNETLDEIARTLFTSWFVNFDPVRAKAEGRQPEGMDADTAALFPDRFVDSELGPIPEGWKWIRFGDIATNIRDGMPTAEIHSDLNYIGLEHMPRRSIALTEWESASKVTSNKSRFQENDVLFGKLRPYFHKVGLAPVNGICSTDILVIRPKAGDHLAWVLAVASSDEMVQRAVMRSSGTRMPRANWNDLADFLIADPGCKVATMFEDRIRLMLELIKHNVHESRTLVELRDTLLPELISGRVQVGEDGTLVGEVV